MLAVVSTSMRAVKLRSKKIFYRVGQKSKLLIVSKYVNKTEKIGGT